MSAKDSGDGKLHRNCWANDQSIYAPQPAETDAKRTNRGSGEGSVRLSYLYGRRRAAHFASLRLGQ